MAGLFGGQATLKPYNPTLRDKLALAMMGSADPNSAWGRVVEGLTGSTGLGVNRSGVVDFVPAVGAALQAQEGGRDIATPGRRGHGAASVALAAIPIPAAAKAGRGLIGGAAKAIEKEATPIVAYHGSPHKFDAFDLSKIGTGEGHQAFGHGLYFAENEATAKAYRDALRGKDTIPVINARLHELSREMDQYRVGGQYGVFNSPRGYELKAEYEALLDAREAEKGHMYQVGIKADPAHFLDWDKPLSEQPENVRAILGDYANETAGAKLSRAYRNPLFGGDVIGADQASADQVSQFMADQGVPGIKYLDQASRGTGEGTRNFVVFKPELIDILKRYGLLGPALGAGAAAQANGER